MQAIPKDKGHLIKEADKARIKCDYCGKPAYACQYVRWDTGNTKGISFSYLCEKHYQARYGLDNWKATHAPTEAGTYTYNGYTYQETFTEVCGQRIGRTYLLYNGKQMRLEDAYEELHDPNLAGYFPWAWLRGLVDLNGKEITA